MATNTQTSAAYPVWAVICDCVGFEDDEGKVIVTSENIGTDCPYVEYCPACGKENPETRKFESYEAMEDAL